MMPDDDKIMNAKLEEMSFNLSPPDVATFTFTLHKDETVLWVGHPDVDLYVRQEKRVALILCLGGLVLCFPMVFSGDGPLFFYCFVLIPTFTLGLYGLIQNVVTPHWSYVLTTERLLSDYHHDGPSLICELPLTEVQSLTTSANHEGKGTIEFRTASKNPDRLTGFRCIGDVASVAAMIEKYRICSIEAKEGLDEPEDAE